MNREFDGTLMPKSGAVVGMIIDLRWSECNRALEIDHKAIQRKPRRAPVEEIYILDVVHRS